MDEQEQGADWQARAVNLRREVLKAEDALEAARVHLIRQAEKISPVIHGLQMAVEASGLARDAGWREAATRTGYVALGHTEDGGVSCHPEVAPGAGRSEG